MFNGFELPSEITRVLAIGDVHGCVDALTEIVRIAKSKEAYPLFLGDIVGRGDDSVGCMEIVAELVASGDGFLVAGNHDVDFADAFFARAPRSRYAQAIFSQMRSNERAPAIAALFATAVDASPRWIRFGRKTLFVHAAFDRRMLKSDEAPSRSLADFACKGQPGLGTDEFGCQIRDHRWVHDVPFGLDVYFGHDVLSSRVPKLLTGAMGGCAYAMDTGCVFHGVLSGALVDRDVGFVEFIKAETSRPLMVKA